MTSRLLQPKARGFDGASFRRFTAFNRVVNAGGEWVSLYLGGDYGVDSSVIEAAWAAGLGVMLNFERYDQAAKYGYAQGKAHALTAVAQATQLGFHGEAPLIFSGADFSPTGDQVGAVLDYHRALVDFYTLGPGGAYGPRTVLELLSRQPWWPDDWPLWHWGGDGGTEYPWAWVKQGPGPAYYDATIGFNVDKNTLLKPMRFWSGYGDDPVPIPKELVMPGHIAYGQSPTRGIVQFVTTFYGPPKWRYTAGEGAAVFCAYPAGTTIPPVADADLDVIGEYDPSEDARWLGQHLGGGGQGLVAHVHDNGATGPARGV